MAPATITRNAPAGGDWDTASDWNLNRVPGAGDDAVINDLNAGAVVTHGQNTSDSVHSITISTGSLVLSAGSLTLGTTTQASSGSTLTFEGGTLVNGTILPGTDTVFTGSGGALNGVTAESNLDFASNNAAYAFILNGLMLDNATISLGNTAGTTYGYLSFSGNVVLGGTGTVRCGAAGSSNGFFESSSGGTLTLGSGVTLDGTDGDVLANKPGEFINQGTIAADAGGGGSGGTITIDAGMRSITVVYRGSTDFQTSTSAAFTQTVNQDSTTSSVSSSANPSTSGQSVTFTATVTANAPGSGTPTGNVAFLNGTVTLGTKGLSGGQATFTTSSLAVGVDSITVVYRGNADFQTSTSAVLSQTVNPAGTVTILTSSLNKQLTPAAGPNEAATYIAGSQLSASLGTDGAGAICENSFSNPGAYDSNGRPCYEVEPYFANLAALGLLSAPAAVQSTNPLTVAQGYFTWYLNHLGSNGTINNYWYHSDGTAAIPVNPPPNPPLIPGTNQSDPDSNDSYASTFLAAVWPYYKDGGSLTGFQESQFEEVGNVVLGCQQTDGLTTPFLNASTNPDGYTQDNSESYAGLTAMSLIASQVYGDSATAQTYANAAGRVGSALLTLDYNSSTGLFNIDYNTQTGVSDPANLSSWYPGTTPLAWPIIFGVVAPTSPIALDQMAAIDASWNGMSQQNWTTMSDSAPIGFAALITGDTQRAGAYASTLEADLFPTPPAGATVTDYGWLLRMLTTPVVTATSSADPSVYGQSVTFTATLASAGGTPTGTVTFLKGATTLGTATLTGGQATLATSALSLGVKSITVIYGGDANFTGSTSAVLTQTVNQDGTTTSVSSAVNPAVFGQKVTFTATVTANAPGSGMPAGSVTFLKGGTTLGTVPLSGGQATLATSSLVLGVNSITAQYHGNADFLGSTSAVFLQTVNQDSTTSSVSSSANPSVFGQTLTFTATVTANAPGSGTPTGNVAFLNGAATLGTVSLSGGHATLTTSALAVGMRSITVVYRGSTDFQTSTSAAFSQTVNQDSTTSSVSSSANPSTSGQSVTFTATVTANAPGSGTPTGNVAFLNGTVTLGTKGLSGGQATFATSSLAVGVDSITVVYRGNADFQTSTSAVLSQTVNPNGAVTILTSWLNRLLISAASADAGLSRFVSFTPANPASTPVHQEFIRAAPTAAQRRSTASTGRWSPNLNRTSDMILDDLLSALDQLFAGTGNGMPRRIASIPSSR